MKEWNSALNPFNSLKALIYREWLEKCAAGECPVPVTVAIDPTNKCNLDCIWCNAYNMIHQDKKELSKDHLLNLADLLKVWGVISTCIAGGGEPLMNPSTNDFMIKCYKNKIANSIITNGTLLNISNMEIIANTCRWIGISVDAGTENTYIKVKGIKNKNFFNIVLDNITTLRKIIDETGAECEIGYKFLLHPNNQHEILRAAEVAKMAGAHEFQVRPVGWENHYLAKGQLKWDYESIDRQLELMFELGTEKFRVYGIRHKYAEDLKRKVNFTKCRAASLHPAFCADGMVHACIDMRGREDLVLCEHFDVMKFWNSDKHKKIMDNIDVTKCTKCTFSGYNEIIESVFIKDKMCRKHI